MYTVDFRLRNHDLEDPARPVSVQATPEEIERFATEGYLVRERLLRGAQLDRFRAAMDEVAAAETGGQQATSPTSTSPTSTSPTSTSASSRFGGLFLRHLMDKHPAFLDLLRFAPTLSVARALLGPQVQLRGVSARITYPDQPHQETHWHFHQRLVPDPVPAFFSRPQTIDVLLYLDDVDDANGPLSLVPGSHRWIDRDLPADHYGDQPGQVVLRPTAGTAVMCHGSLWHRAAPNTAEGTVRRLLLFGYGPTWMKRSIYGERPKDPLTDALLADADEETRELLGATGWM
jgi:ectoine hydroxylase-related dioxygenase (phytanoyl-CoA dioxygenase family)